MTAPVAVAFNDAGTRAALTLFHAKGNIITAAMVDALSSALDDVARNPHLKLVTIAGAGADFSFGASIPEHAPGRIATMLVTRIVRPYSGREASTVCVRTSKP